MLVVCLLAFANCFHCWELPELFFCQNLLLLTISLSGSHTLRVTLKVKHLKLHISCRSGTNLQFCLHFFNNAIEFISRPICVSVFVISQMLFFLVILLCHKMMCCMSALCKRTTLRALFQLYCVQLAKSSL